MPETIPVTCDLDSGDTAIFDAPDTEADDHDETWQVYEMFVSILGD
jgi:hypothetical protein